MIQYNDTDLNALIAAGREATSRLSMLKFKKQSHLKKELLVFRRSQLGLIRKRVAELRLSETDFDTIHWYVTNNDLS